MGGIRHDKSKLTSRIRWHLSAWLGIHDIWDAYELHVKQLDDKIRLQQTQIDGMASILNELIRDNPLNNPKHSLVRLRSGIDILTAYANELNDRLNEKM